LRGVTVAVLIKSSAAALKALEEPLLAFSKDDDLAKLLTKIEAAEGLNVKFKAALARDAKASLAAKEAWKDVIGAGSGLRGLLPSAARTHPDYLGPHTATVLMSGRPAPPNWRVDEIRDSHCTRLYNHA
jgi:hypothetical protein